MTMTGNGTDSIGNDSFRANTKDYIIAFDASPKCVLDELMAFKLLYLRFIIFIGSKEVCCKNLNIIELQNLVVTSTLKKG